MAQGCLLSSEAVILQKVCNLEAVIEGLDAHEDINIQSRVS